MNSRDRGFRGSRQRDVDDDYQPAQGGFRSAPRDLQRFEAPSGPPVQATVKWYNPDKGFGFVGLTDGSGDAFLHARVVEASGYASLPPGATLAVHTIPGQRGAQVSDIVSVDTSTAQADMPRRPRPDRYDDNRPTVEEIGVVKWYNALKGFGFISPERGGRDFFVHASAVERSGLVNLSEGQRVSVDVADGQKGPEVVTIRLI